ncbi:DUF6065 family protein [Streptomyces sp. NBC_01190]|uniref:DUF6065 family protein n=1 Tax=Streptomyces sp. NBC_01190 TaxID=2903767 RepID=UPI003866AE52|nr:DUF6065 family protein [Streptomyces sp. NBC_01190]
MRNSVPVVRTDEDDQELPLIGYTVAERAAMRIVPAPANRAWIAAGSDGFARRCLPLMMANQAEWWILNSHTFSAIWEGNRRSSALRLDYGDQQDPYPAVSHFGHGIITFELPFLFRTPPGWNLTAGGPTNLPKDGVSPLAGLIETDWTSAYFTMNWQITRPDTTIVFEAGEPICAIRPDRRGDLARFRPVLLPKDGSPAEQGSREFEESRVKFGTEQRIPGTPAYAAKWQRHYLRGESVTGERFPDHEKKLKLRPFGSPGDPTPESRSELP